MKWHEVCWSIPAAIKEVLVAWEHEALTANDVKRILDTMKARMCCLPVCAAAWLCSYMQVMSVVNIVLTPRLSSTFYLTVYMKRFCFYALINLSFFIFPADSTSRRAFKTYEHGSTVFP